MSNGSSVTRLGAILLACCLWAGMLVLGPVGAGASTEPVIRTLSPAPGELVDDGRVRVTAGVQFTDPLATAQMKVNGVRLDTLVEDVADSEAVVSAVAPVDAGDHKVEVAVETANGATAQRSWMITTTDRRSERLSGPDRFATAAALSQAVFDEDHTAEAAVLARAEDFADALAGAPLAAALEGPLLLSTGDGVPSVTADELQRALAEGATVHLLGGEAALGDQVAQDVEALGFTAKRHAGDGRVETAAAVARALPDYSEAIVAAAGSFPDALAASAPAALEGIPILLTGSEELPTATAAVLERRDVTRVTVVGGTEMVGPEVMDDIAEVVDRVDRLSGSTRFATSVEVMEAYFNTPSGVSLASGMDFPDALAGATHAFANEQPLLLAAGDGLAEEVEDALRAHQPPDITVYGGTAAIKRSVEDAAVMASVAGRGAPEVTDSWPWPDHRLPRLGEARVDFEGGFDSSRSSIYVEVDGVELPGDLERDGGSLVFVPEGPPEGLQIDEDHDSRMVVAATSDSGGRLFAQIPFTYVDPDPDYATVEGLDLHLPSAHVEIIGYHESSHRGSQQQYDRETGTETLTMPSRGRGTPARSSSDVVSDPDLPVLAPVTGKVKRAESYWLYGEYPDELVVIEPEDNPRLETVVLHVDGLVVEEGDRVEAGTTELAKAPRSFPFTSQVDRYSSDLNWPHTHVEVVHLDRFNAAGHACVSEAVPADPADGAICLEPFLGY